MGIFDALINLNDKFFEGLKKKSTDSALQKSSKRNITESLKKGEELLYKAKKHKLDKNEIDIFENKLKEISKKESNLSVSKKLSNIVSDFSDYVRGEIELNNITGSMPTPRMGDGKSTDEIMQLITDYVKSRGESKNPVIEDFIDLNKNESLNIRIRYLSDTGQGFISDYRTALLNAGPENLKNPSDIERVINNNIEPDDEENLNNAKGNRNLEQAAEYIQNNFKSLSEYFLPTAKFAVINQSIDTSFIQKTFKIGYFKASEVIEQLESAGMITEIPENSEYSALLNGQEDLDAILLLLREDIQNKLKEQLKKC